MSQSGQLNRFNRNRGYESIPRDFLQSEELSLESIGFLCNLQSYPETWVLYKTELYKRYSKNKRSSIERIWNELLDAGYIIQYRKREGKKYVYQYYFALTIFTQIDLDQIEEVMSVAGYTIYSKDQIPKSVNVDKKSIEVKEDKVEKVWDVENQQSKENAVKSTFFGMLNFDSSKPTPNRLTIKEIDDDDINKNSNSLQKLNFDLQANENLKTVGRYLASSGVDYDDMIKILNAIHADDRLLDSKMITEQMNWCIVKSEREGINDFAKYFIGGLEKKIESRRVRTNVDFEDQFVANMSSVNGEILKKVPLDNWLL